MASAKKSTAERTTKLQEEIMMIEKRRATDLIRLQEKKALLKKIEDEAIVRQVAAYKLSPADLKKLLKRHATDSAGSLSEESQRLEAQEVDSAFPNS